ncbi:hypothetical protein EPI11_11400 [Flavobacterium cerinum]|uniref:Toxin-antitoxin system YwqK family antitoxin n=2 Tax=Flavobacterium cerinum TaxID=2502784 RepID=A0A3S3Q888_9FLAO|nr:hypothetical protein EPI11_11400 [Flavobacterium cerinum]
MIVRSILLLLLFCCNVGNGQVQFQLQRITPCDSLPYIEKETYFLIDATGVEVESFSNMDSDVITLPRPGKYIVQRVTEPGLEYYTIELKEGLTIETCYDPKIMFRQPWIVDSDFVYFVCGKPAYGYQEDFYPDGKIKIRGTFKDGFVTDSLVEYYSNGKLQRKVRYKKDGVHTDRYDSLGKKTSYFWSARRGYMVYGGWREIIYFSNEKINLDISEIGHIVKIEGYYPNGNLKIKQTKKKRIEYYESGNIKTIYSWKANKEFDNTIDNESIYYYTFQIQVKNYDEKGRLINEEYKEEDGNSYPQPSIAYENKFR